MGHVLLQYLLQSSLLRNTQNTTNSRFFLMSYFFYIINHKTYDFLNTHVLVCQPSPAKSAKKMVAARSKTIH